MSNQEQPANFGADATENNLAGTPDEFNDAVTAQLLDEVKAEKQETPRGGTENSGGGQAQEREERDDQPALEVDGDSPASEAKPAS
ncbi:hypothetical protein QMA10_02175 [Arthrobacter sp. APC 3897]|uniref:hypothetical protein n=1 Tax=Arthrobacter sp. APC 3897 TaxID=3035204 RepID=UPI0025B39A61|nr:hypothetical protein [Arthrobacter sp. APC 3897]MDN3480733.1 hypothetical protein [Arthrobacter sp. APC 3897]